LENIRNLFITKNHPLFFNMTMNEQRAYNIAGGLTGLFIGLFITRIIGGSYGIAFTESNTGLIWSVTTVVGISIGKYLYER